MCVAWTRGALERGQGCGSTTPSPGQSNGEPIHRDDIRLCWNFCDSSACHYCLCVESAIPIIVSGGRARRHAHAVFFVTQHSISMLTQTNTVCCSRQTTVLCLYTIIYVARTPFSQTCSSHSVKPMADGGSFLSHPCAYPGTANRQVARSLLQSTVEVHK